MAGVKSETNTGGHLWENNSTNVYYGANMWEIAGVIIGAIGLTLAFAKAYYEIRRHCRHQGVRNHHRRQRERGGGHGYGPWDSMRLRDIERRNRDFEDEGRKIQSAIASMQLQIESFNRQQMAIQPVAEARQQSSMAYPGYIYGMRGGYPGNGNTTNAGTNGAGNSTTANLN